MSTLIALLRWILKIAVNVGMYGLLWFGISHLLGEVFDVTSIGIRWFLAVVICVLLVLLRDSCRDATFPHLTAGMAKRQHAETHVKDNFGAGQPEIPTNP